MPGVAWRGVACPSRAGNLSVGFKICLLVGALKYLFVCGMLCIGVVLIINYKFVRLMLNSLNARIRVDVVLDSHSN